MLGHGGCRVTAASRQQGWPHTWYCDPTSPNRTPPAPQACYVSRLPQINCSMLGRGDVEDMDGHLDNCG